MLAAHLERGETEDAVGRSIAALHELRAPRVYRMRNKALAQREPRMPMSRAMTLVMYAAVFVVTKLEWVAGLFGRKDSWDAKVEVDRYMARNR